ncbi:MAG: glycosyltransferase [Pseudomonadota bacterium]
MSKLLILGVTHTAQSPRLLYRQVFKLAQRCPHVHCVYVGRSSFGDSEESHELLPVIRPRGKTNVKLKGRRWWSTFRLGLQTRPEWVQASDVRELALGLVICVITRARLIYDAHEDYFNQPYEYSGKTLRGWIKGVNFRVQEILLVRFASAVFCTDEYLFNLYRRKMFGAEKVHLLRNFTNVDFVDERASAPDPAKPLRLVYIGGVNRFRGVIECAEFVDRFNSEEGHKVLTLDIYSHKNELIRELSARGLIRHRRHLRPPMMLKRLSEYHVGICLWQNLEKFKRNLPMKNFDYMAVGLPVITSDFENLRRQTGAAGCCISPDSYEAFRQAIEGLRNPVRWSQMSESAIESTRQRFDLDDEIKNYLNVFQC